MEYVCAPPTVECLFCWAAEPAGQDSALLRGQRATVMLNAYPYNSGHLLVAPVQHVPNITELSPEDLGYLFEMVRAAMLALERTLRPQGYNVGINVRRPGGAGIEQHVHVHVVPRWEGDTNFMSVVADTRVVPEALQACYERLAPALADAAAELGLLGGSPEGEQ
jgi:ATP adenylyltransferase